MSVSGLQQGIEAADAPAYDKQVMQGLLDKQPKGQAPQLTINKGTIMLWPPDTSAPLFQQTRTVVLHLSKSEPETLVCWAPTTCATKNATSVKTLLLSCIKCLPDIKSVRGLMQNTSTTTVLAPANTLPDGSKGSDKNGQASIPQPVDQYMLSRRDLKSPTVRSACLVGMHIRMPRWFPCHCSGVPTTLHIWCLPLTRWSWLSGANTHALHGYFPGGFACVGSTPLGQKLGCYLSLSITSLPCPGCAACDRRL